MDGTDFRIKNPGEGFFSYKFRAPGIRYEVGIALQSGNIVWLSPGYPASSHDISIFREGLKYVLKDCGEMAVADQGYQGEPFQIELPHEGPRQWRRFKAEARSRHETCNNRFKKWAVLGNRFRHDAIFHTYCFTAVAVLTELGIQNGHPLYQI